MALRWAPHFSAGSLAWGEIFGVAPAPVAPPAPSAVAGSATGATTASGTFTDNSGGTAAHRVQVRALPGGSYADAAGFTNPIPAGTTTFTATGLAAGLEHQLQIRAERSGLNSAYAQSSTWWQDIAVGGGGELPGPGAPPPPPPPADTAAPMLTGGSVTGGILTADASISADEAGTLFWLLNQSAAALAIPPVPGAMSGWNSRALAVGLNSWSLGSQSVGSGYYLHVCAQDDEATPNRRSADLVLGPFTVAAASPPPSTPPSFTLNPISQAVVVGQLVTLTVAVAGTAPITVQWRRAGVAIPSANGLSYSFTAQLSDNGVAIDAVATGAGSPAVSGTATLMVSPAPLVALPMYTLFAPRDQIDNLGGFGPKDPDSRVLLAFEFKRWLMAVSDADVGIIRWRGAVDEDPESVLDGERILQGTQVLQWVKAGVLNTDYELRVVATGPDGSKAVLEGILPVRDA